MSALAVQANVIGALILRELHTRFGRQNIGYLWLFAEPMLLAVAVAALHAGEHLPMAGGVRPVPFAIGGYGLYIMFRSVVSRAETLLEANRPLLNHRQVTLFDMLAARSLLELGATVAVLAILLTAAWALGMGEAPHDIVRVAAAVLLVAWFSFGLAMLVTAGSHLSPALGRLIHPILYLTLPLSGAFFVVQWLPTQWRDTVGWIPLVSMFELLKAGQFEGVGTGDVHLLYVLGWCVGLTVAGLLALRAVRRSIDLS